jgi:hypothetical protein
MIHRIDRVNPDVDDRVIKPNEARMASNLRFGASTEDTNLSGGTLVLGNKEVSFTPPSGNVNKVVGVYADLETNSVFFALYNSDTKHGIFRINGATNAVDTIIGVDVLGNNQGALLNFQPQDTYNVSISVIQGLLYWTDNLNEPGVINIEKGIRTMSNTPLPGDPSSVYHSAFSDTNFLQVKRPPAILLDVYRIFVTSFQSISTAEILNMVFSPIQIQSIFTNDFDPFGLGLASWKKNYVNTDGVQFSYYYVYDNNEESKLAPWTDPVFWKKNIVVQVPNLEVNNFLARNTTSAPTFQPSTVKRVVFVYRVNNDGVPFVMGSVNNTQTNYLLPTNQPSFSSSALNTSTSLPFNPNLASLRMLSADTTSLIRTPVSTDIAEQRFDSVPLKSATNTIAQNRLNHANYILDRNSWQGMTLSLQVVPELPPNTPGNIIYTYNLVGLFRPGGTYEIGIELLDKAGRPIGVIANREITIPQMRVTSNPYKYRTGNGYNAATLDRGDTINFNSTNYNDVNNLYRVTFTVTGALPPWAASFRIVSSGDKQASFFHRGLTQIYYWFQSPDGVNVPLIYQFLPGTPTIPTNNPSIPKPNRLFQPLPDTIVLFGGGAQSAAMPKDARTAAFKGYAIAKGTIPVTYNEGDELYIKIGAQRFPAYLNVNSQTALAAATVNSQIVPIQEYKIVGEENGLFFIEATDTSLYPTVPEPGFVNWGGPGGDIFNSYASKLYWWDTFPAKELYIPVYYDIEVYKKKTVEQTVFYQNNGIIPASSYNNNSLTGTVQGDCYVTSYSSTITPQGTQNIGIIPYITGNVTTNQNQIFNKEIPPSNAWYETRTVQFNALTNVAGIFYSMNPNSYNTEEWTWQKGQPAIVNENQREVRIDNGIIFSSPFVQGTQINGLNQFNSLDFRLSPVENGPISSLVVTNATQKEPGVMLAIGANGVSSFYYDAIQLTNVDGTDNVATTTSYLASQRPLLGQYGTTRQMSITKTPLGSVYWWSDVVNDLIRYTNAGLERLGMTFSFANYLRKTYNDNALLFTWYDQVTDEILLCGKLRETSVFSERYKTFQGERSYKNFLGKCPERGIGLATKQFLFLEGKIWVTDVDLLGLNAPPNNFIFGEFKDPLLNIVTNESPANVKRWNQIKVFGSRPGSVELQAPDETEGLSGVLESTLNTGNWIKRKGDWEAAIRRAANTPGGLLAGKLMESRILYSKFAFGADGFQKLNFIEIKSNVSIVQ